MTSEISHASADPDLRILAILERIEQIAIVAIVLVAGGVLTVWLVPSLTAFLPSDRPPLMRSVTAFAMLVSASSLTLTASRRSRMAVRIGILAAVAVVTLGAVSLLTYLDLVPYTADSWIRRPSVQASSALVLSGACMAFIRPSKGGPSLVADILAVGLVGFVLFFFGANLFSGLELVGVDAGGLKSPQTLLCMVLLAFIVASRRAARGRVLSFLVSRGIGSETVRLIFPVVVCTPFLMFAILAWIGSRDLLPINLTRAIAAPVLAVTMFAALAWIGRRANQLEKQLRMQSMTDQLTNVLNRRGFAIVAEYLMRNAERQGIGVTAFYFDLDGLKRINDFAGHDAGSLAIRIFADMLVATFRKNDVIARIGGDEFVVLAADAGNSVPVILARLSSIAAATAGNAISYSAGFAALKAGGARTIDELVAEADQMMYRQKSIKKAA